MVVAGLEKATRGRVEVAGRDFMKLDEDALALVRGAKSASFSSRSTSFRL